MDRAVERAPVRRGVDWPRARPHPPTRARRGSPWASFTGWLLGAALGACTSAPQLGPVDPEPPPSDAMAGILTEFSGLDVDADGVAEIESLDEPFAPITPSAGASLTLLLVSPDYVREARGAPPLGAPISAAELRTALETLQLDIARDGFAARVITTRVYTGPRHQDGRTVVALRRFLQRVSQHFPLSNVVFVGSFPEPTLVRRVLLRHATSFISEAGVAHDGVEVLEVASELVAGRTDLVLSDLDGAWDALYVPEVTVEDVLMVPAGSESFEDWPVGGTTYTSTSLDSLRRVSTYRDVFYLRDEATRLEFVDGEARLSVEQTNEVGPELTNTDRTRANPIAMPEITVTRINPQHVAVLPYTATGELALADDGKPRVVEDVRGEGIHWRWDETLERRILLDYLARNHAFRSRTTDEVQLRAGASRGNSSLDLISAANLAEFLWSASDSFGAPLVSDFTDLTGHVEWLKQPVVLRGISAHATADRADFGVPPDLALLEAAIGGRPWSWTRSAATGMLEPSLRDFGSGGFEVYRTLFENGALRGSGDSFYVHDGCSANSPWFVNDAPYDSRAGSGVHWYGQKQLAESTMFFANGLGIIARAKVFYDLPRGAMESVNASGRFGTAILGYFRGEESNRLLDPGGASSWEDHRQRVLGHKRVYFWSMLGDPTLRVRY